MLQKGCDHDSKQDNKFIHPDENSAVSSVSSAGKAATPVKSDMHAHISVSVQCFGV